MQIPLSQPSITDADVEAVLSVLRTPTLSIGPQVRAFVEAVAAYTGVAEAVAVNSGTSGLQCNYYINARASRETRRMTFGFRNWRGRIGSSSAVT